LRKKRITYRTTELDAEVWLSDEPQKVETV
jgi:hypothetical protein